MHQNAPRETGIGVERESRESFGDLLIRLATASAGLVRDEIELAGHEIREKFKSLRTGMILTTIAVLSGIIALMTLDAALVIAIGKVIGFGFAALAIGIAVAIIAGVFAGVGIAHFKKDKVEAGGIHS